MAKYQSTPVLIDWLSISGKSTGYQLESLQVVKLEHGTSVFSCIEEIFKKSKRIATVTSHAYSEIIDKNLIIVKFDNWVLYDANFWTIYSGIIEELRINAVKISRIDICKDFNYFYNKRNPKNLIKGFLTGDLIKLGKSKYSVWGETNEGLTYDYLSFGKKSSTLNVYLYDKSKELTQVKNKPWIRNKWVQYNLDQSLPVYRLEFSIKKSEIGLINKSTGEEVSFTVNDLFSDELLQLLYDTLLSKYFHFKIYSGNSNVSREVSVKLFENETFDEIIWEVEDSLETNRSDKIFLKKLDTLYSELRTDDLALFKAIEQLRSVFSTRKNLTEYLEEKITPATLMMLEHPAYFAPDLKKKAINGDLGNVDKSVYSDFFG